ncbi:MAG: zf-HC2 domain-containing protein [Ruminococcus sp.]|nr:zf-HC2 domain-containing protein [Ruminococcus sp.]
MNCNIIRDLIPLYIDGCLSDESIELVEEHLELCDECKGLLRLMKASEPVQEVTERISSDESIKRVSVWKASILQAVLQLLSFLLIVFGVTIEASDSDINNGFWATGLIVPATGFMLSIINWYFIRLYRDRDKFSLVSSLCTLTFIIVGYVWAVGHYGFSCLDDYTDFGFNGVLYGIPISIILCIFSAVFADKYGKLIGKERMKQRKTPDPKMFTVLAFFFCVANAFTPLSIIITALTGFTFDIRSYPLWVVLHLLLSGLLAVLMIGLESKEASRADRILLTVALFMSILNWAVCLFTGTPQYNRAHNAVVIGTLMAVSAVAIFVSVKFIKPLEKGITRSVIAGVFAVLLTFLSFIIIVFSGFGENAVVQSVDSPTGRYTAELVASDQGALGGDTVVYVTDNLLRVDFGLFTIHKAKETVYFGEWWEYESVTLQWVDNDTLSVGGHQYNMK